MRRVGWNIFPKTSMFIQFHCVFFNHSQPFRKSLEDQKPQPFWKNPPSSPTKQGSWKQPTQTMQHFEGNPSKLPYICMAWYLPEWLPHLSNDEKSKLQFTEKLLRGSRQQVHVVRSDLIRWRPRGIRDSPRVGTSRNPCPPPILSPQILE